jgi:hypothetical protein
MSTSSSPILEGKTNPLNPADPKPLTNEYHKARKQLMLWAGILFVWELVGIDLEKAQTAGGNVGALVGSIKSPNAVPWVLLILVGYFLFRFTIEWLQCNSSRRGMMVTKVDFAASWGVTLLAYALYIFQAIKKVQFAAVVQGTSVNSRASLSAGLVSGFMAGVSLFLVVRGDFREWKLSGVAKLSWGRIIGALANVAVLLTTVNVAFPFVFGFGLSWLTLFKGGLIGSILGVIICSGPDLLLQALNKRTLKRQAALSPDED